MVRGSAPDHGTLPHQVFSAARRKRGLGLGLGLLESKLMLHGPPAFQPSQLLLFDEEPPPVALTAQAIRPSPNAAPAPVAAAAAPARPAPLLPPPSPAPAPAPAPISSVFQHPRSQRDIQLGSHRVSYELRRARRRSIGFSIAVEGLTVSAPRWVGQADVDKALREKADWILRKLHEQRERGQRVAAAKVDWRDGTAIPFLGETVTLVLDPRATGAMLNSSADALPGLSRLTLHLGLPHTAEPAQIRDLVQSWMQRQARRIFEERCQLVAPRLGVRMKRLSLSSAATRWGSASADGSIRLNWRLLHFALPVIDYVVTHELAHLREMNHSPAFWDVVRSALPEFEQARGSLRSEVLPVFD